MIMSSFASAFPLPPSPPASSIDSMSLSPPDSSHSAIPWPPPEPIPIRAASSTEHHEQQQQPQQPQQQRPRRGRRTPTSSDASAGLKWVTVSKLNDFKNRKVMKEVRHHVMVDYLSKRQSNDPPPQTRPSQAGTALRPALNPSSCDVTPNEQALALYHGESRRRKLTRKALARPSSRPGLAQDQHVLSQPQVVLDRYYDAQRKISDPIAQPLVRLPAKSSAPFPFDDAFKNLTPLSYDIGRPLDPFRTLPQSSSDIVNVENLKFYCSQFFGTRAMAPRWVPALLKQRHTFLSTLCLAATQIDVMHNRLTEDLQTTRLRYEVVQLIGQSLANPKSQVDDSTIIAVLLLTSAELIRGDPRVMVWHENGLDRMVNLRGGLATLGVAPDLAVMMTMITFLSAISREAQPRRFYLDFAESYPRDSFLPKTPIPESPLYCPRREFGTLTCTVKCKKVTFDLLCDMTEMIELFVSTPYPFSNAKTRNRRDSAASSSECRQSSKQINDRIQTLYTQIIQLPSAEDDSKDVFRDWTYEACRIAACISATAMAKCIPFSVATQVAASRQAYPSPNSRAPSPQTRMQSPAGACHATLLRALRAALLQADPFKCWIDNNMTGVFLWILLVGSAATAGFHAPLQVPQTPDEDSPLPSPPASGVYANSESGHSSVEDQLLRRWIVAMAVQCSTLLAFEHKGAMMESMRRFLRVGERLGNMMDVQQGGIITISGPSSLIDAGGSSPRSPSSKRRRII